MSYTKTNWKTGDIVTANKLNNMEDGIASAGGVMLIGATKEGSTTTLDKTWQEIYDAMHNGILCVYSDEEATSAVTFYVIVSVYQEEVIPIGQIAYKVDADPDGVMSFSATSPDGYPVRTVS